MTGVDRRAFLRGVLAAGSAGSVLATGGATAQADPSWPGFQYDAGNSGEQSTATAPRQGLIEEQIYAINHSVAGSPAIADGTLYVATTADAAASDEPTFWAFDIEDGSVAWSVEGINSPDTDVPVLVHDGLVYLKDGYTNEVHAFDAQTGSLVWTKRAMVGSLGYEPTHDLVLCGRFAFDGKTGSQVWTGPKWIRTTNAPAVRDGVIYYSGDSLVAVSAEDGRQEWRLKATTPIAAPTATKEAVYVPNDYRRLMAHDPSDGSVLWKSKQFAKQVTTSVAATQNTVYVVYGAVHALRTSDGSVRWSIGRDQFDPRPQTSPIIVDGVMYLPATGPDGGYLHAVDVTAGEQIARVPLTGEGGTVAAAGDGAVYTGFENESAGGGMSRVVSVLQDRPETFAVEQLGLENEYNSGDSISIPDGEVSQGEKIRLTATVRNTGSKIASDLVTLSFGDVFSESYTVRDVPPGAALELYAVVRLGTVDPGSYTFSATTGGDTEQQTITVRRFGDVNHDGSVSPSDAIKTQRQIINMDTNGTYNPAAGDITHDRKISPGDVTRLQKTIVDLFDPQTDLGLDTTVQKRGKRQLDS